MKKPVIIGVLVGGVIIAALLVWGSFRDDDPNTLKLHGNVDIRQVSLAFDGNGRVAQLQVEEGDAVKAGQVLALMDTRTLSLQAEQARAQIAVQQSNLLRMRNGSRPEEIAQARSRVAAANADIALARQDLLRLQGIGEKTQGRGVSMQDLDRAKSALQVARAKGREQQEALRLAELGPRAEDVASAQAQLQASQAQLALLEHQIDLGTLIAPTDAVVRSRLLEAGDMATPQRPVFALALTKPKWVRVFIGEADLGRIKPGMSAQVFTDSHPDQPVAGKVGYISSVAEFTPKAVQTEELRTKLVYEVRVWVEDDSDVLRLGQPATVNLTVGDAQ
ncbi:MULTISPECIES: HlyD family efflux transporter periplasmic adaptor subunit [Pseudomonas]|uniref:Multidrug resistance protein MdtN n=1 Tax=Pseudomonas putida TaxID=303 RepID=A0A1B2F2Q5_PSEPU|nr:MULTISPECIES: HlyD family efflux transporter periplasmic adaptor subunit [Pseudomonas]ANY86464.1 Multidrug resistance protein MdtN [Pseudomonas putida]MCL8306179.1 HlyD family efflux transporter periplasmic adaptor subunit [Pseudomonas putida]